MKILILLITLLYNTAFAEQIGEVSTTYKFMGSNDKIVIETFEDPKIKGINCYLSRAKTGGVSGLLGLAEDRSEAAISCLKVTNKVLLPKSVLNGHDNGEDVFKKSTSIMFKSIQVVRFFDKQRGVLIYLTYSDKLIDGSPDNAISVVYIY